MTMFSYDLDRSSKILKIFHNFVSFYRIINYWNDVNKRVADEFFEVLYLEKNIMSLDTFNKFRLLIHLICVDCHQQEKFHFFFFFFFGRLI